MLRKIKKQEVTINLTPLIDVVFLLLIFFMVTTSFTRETQIKLQLPKADVESLDSKPQLVEISIDKEGRIFVNSKGLVNGEVDTLKRALEPLLAGNKDTPVIISADADTSYQSVVTAMDATSQLGVSNLKMATQRSSQ